MPVNGVSTTTMLLAVVGVFALFWAVLWLLTDNDGKEAAKKTGQKSVGLGLGTVGGMLSLMAGVIKPLLLEPGLIITVLGLGGILGGFSVEAFVAGVMVTYVVASMFGWRYGADEGGS
jgi:hypothetical protein